MTYGERIRRGREAKALTQEELAEALGVSRQAVSKWEGDLSRPAAGKLALLSETLDIPWDAWQAMDAEEAAAQAAARETEGERRARKWRRGSAALAALLCLLSPDKRPPLGEAPPGGGRPGRGDFPHRRLSGDPDCPGQPGLPLRGRDAGGGSQEPLADPLPER